MNENNEKDKKFNLREILKDKRKKSGITLGLYFIFFILVFIYMGTLSNNQSTNNEPNENTNIKDTYDYGKIKYSYYTPLLSNNYVYKVNYFINEEEKSYEGKRKDNDYSVLADEEYLLDIEELLNVDSILDLIKKSVLDYETSYSSGVMLQSYNVPIDEFCLEYNIALTDDIDKDIVMKIYANNNYVDKIYFDLTNLANISDITITKYEAEVYFSKLNSIK